MAKQKEEPFFTLRALLEQAPSTEAFRKVISLLRSWEDTLTLEVAIDYASEHLDGWDEKTRECTLGWCWPGFPHQEAPPYLSLLRSLYVDRIPLDDDAASTLASCCHLQRVRDLRLYSNKISHDGLIDLLWSPYLTYLREFGCSANHLTDATLKELLHTPACQKLEGLSLNEENLRRQALTSIIEAPCWKRLHTLALANIPLEARGGERLAEGLLATPKHPLRWLTLRRTSLGEEGAEQIANIPRLAGLSLEGNGIGEQGTATLANSQALTTLVSLNLKRNPIGPQGLIALARSPYLQTLRTLQLANIRKRGPIWSDEYDLAMKELAASPLLEHLDHLEIRRSKLSYTELSILATSPYIEQIEKLVLTPFPTKQPMPLQRKGHL